MKLGGLGSGMLVFFLCAACSSSDAEKTGTTLVNGTPDAAVGKPDAAPAEESCQQKFSADRGYGWRSDVSVIITVGDAGSVGTRAPLDRAVADCETRSTPGANCDGAGIITREAAICIAESLHFGAGIRPWHVELLFHGKWNRIVWNVLSTLTSDGMGSMSGATLTIDARTGDVLDTGGWAGQP